ncbi:MAG: ABC transporter permease [Bacteroidota bacterium]
MQEHHPPTFYQKLLKWFCHPSFYEELEGDLFEHFYSDYEEKGLQYARRRYKTEVIKLFRPSVIKNISLNFLTITPAMFKNYLKMSFRNLWKHKDSSIINILGLTVGITGCLLIAIYVQDELKYDQFHPDKDQLYRIYVEAERSSIQEINAISSPMFAATLEGYPEVDYAFRMFEVLGKRLFTQGEESFLEDKAFFAEPEVFDFFHLPLKYGDSKTALSEPNTVVLTEQLANKYFGDTDPIGQELSIQGNQVKVSGVLESLSPHFHLDFNFLFSFEDLNNMVSQERMQSWIWQDFATYFKMKEGTDSEQLEAKLQAFAEETIHPITLEREYLYTPYIQAVKDIYLYSGSFKRDIAIKSNHIYVKGLIGIGFFLLLIACINFINLATAKAVRRSKEVGVRKTSGAIKSQLIVQFITETAVIVSIALLFALVLTIIFLPQINVFSEKELSIFNYFKPQYGLLLLSFVLIVSILAGSYPAFILSGFKPADALKSARLSASNHVGFLRNGLIVLQFSLSILLIISVLIVSQQVSYLAKKDLGFNEEALMFFQLRGSLYDNIEEVSDEWLRLPQVEAVSACFGVPGDIISGDMLMIPGPERKTHPVRLFNVDHNYISTMQLEVIAGRDFSKKQSTDESQAFILNETAIKAFGLGNSPEEAIGKPIEWDMWHYPDSIKRGRIIGVVKDFNYESLHATVTPAMIQIYPESNRTLVLRTQTENLSQTIAEVERVWDSFDTGFPLDYQFVDSRLAAMYKKEQSWNTLLWIGTILAIFIASIGALGLAVYAIEQRRKEIGIRKVLGASVGQIVSLVSKHFLLLILLALVIASPLTWYFMNDWLDNFAYRIHIQWWIFPIAGLVALLVGAVTVGTQGFFAALKSPVNSIRNE